MRKPRKPTTFNFKPFSKQQLRLMNWWRPGIKSAENDFVIADGSIRSGKTIACICGFLQWSQELYSGESFILAGKSMGALKKNVVKPMLQILEAWNWPYIYIRSGSDAHIEVGTNTYYLYGANTEASQDALQGLTAAGAYADEAALFPQSFIDQMIARCSVDGAKIWLNCNPEGPYHYINAEFILKAKQKGVYHLHFTMDDNLTLSPVKKAFFHNAFTGVFFKRFILGLWVASEGLIYQTFADNVDNYIVDDDWLAANPIQYGIIGVDFGGTKSAHSFTFTGFTYGYKEVVTIKEYYRKERINPAQLEADFCDFVRQVQMKYKCYEAYCDSAEQTLISGLEAAVMKNRINIDIKNAIKGSINNRIAFYNSMMAQMRYKIHKSCTHTREALEGAVYDDKQANKDIRLDDGKMNIDSLDSMEYTTESVQDEILYL
ncbi:PBSX family phage terminase large subunit [Parasporobacterium paucivorans]|uniref:Phage terminase, large subunit, PBSX family n=1 Tax=Parasporobacterium paucivorans DSM 15970 TaxID=1122934 RepID=A0A1M6B2Y8_9FIRM|nr:PBSX family phage terminase large subunit [Parasporobacterium paucivorans]SHI43104.1 phage terminase, large subunit, PBSX family [Parasporobacterium paucivorans DSM 15970]